MSLDKIALVALSACAVTLAATPLIRGLLRRLGVLDHPSGERKLHSTPVPYGGGLALFAGFLAGLCMAVALIPDLYFERGNLQALIIGAALAVAVGIADDVLDIRPLLKLAAQLGIAGFMFWCGFRIERISNPFGEQIVLWTWASLAVTLFWFALLMNGINMIDGLDGLAAGIVAISALTLAGIAFDLGQPLSLLLAAILVGACLGFLPFNFHPASVFMGDAGSLLLGFLLASISLTSSSKAPALLALLIPVMAVGLPVFESVYAFGRRVAHGQHPFRGDRQHLHHRFIAMGFPVRRTVFIFYYISVYLGVTAFILQRLETTATLILVFTLAAGGMLLLENLSYLEKRSR